MLENNKKLTILCILEILKNNSDEEHPLTQAEIIKLLYGIYGMECERKSISASIQSLIDFGYDIVKRGRAGYYLNSRELEDSEIRFLIDAVFASKNIPSKQALTLAQKLGAFQSCHKRKKYNYIYKIDDIDKTPNKSFFYNLDIINDALEKGLQIEFKYNIFKADGNLHSRSDEFYLVNPYYTLINQGKYYLLCNRSGYPQLSNYRIDLITDIRLISNSVTPVTKLNGYEKGLDISDYINKNIYMFDGRTQNVTLKLLDDWAVNSVYEWFGNKARVYDKNGECYADVTSEERGIIYWALQYGEQVEVVSPKSVRDKIADLAGKIAERYQR